MSDPKSHVIVGVCGWPTKATRYICEPGDSYEPVPPLPEGAPAVTVTEAVRVTACEAPSSRGFVFVASTKSGL